MLRDSSFVTAALTIAVLGAPLTGCDYLQGSKGNSDAELAAATQKAADAAVAQLLAQQAADRKKAEEEEQAAEMAAMKAEHQAMVLRAKQDEIAKLEAEQLQAARDAKSAADLAEANARAARAEKAAAEAARSARAAKRSAATKVSKTKPKTSTANVARAPTATAAPVPAPTAAVQDLSSTKTWQVRISRGGAIENWEAQVTVQPKQIVFVRPGSSAMAVSGITNAPSMITKPYSVAFYIADSTSRINCALSRQRSDGSYYMGTCSETGQGTYNMQIWY